MQCAEPIFSTTGIVFVCFCSRHGAPRPYPSQPALERFGRRAAGGQRQQAGSNGRASNTNGVTFSLYLAVPLSLCFPAAPSDLRESCVWACATKGSRTQLRGASPIARPVPCNAANSTQTYSRAGVVKTAAALRNTADKLALPAL